MPAFTIKNLPVEVHRALCARAVQHGHTAEAEIRIILEAALCPPKRVKLGTLLASIAREAGALTEVEAEYFHQFREKQQAEPMRLE